MSVTTKKVRLINREKPRESIAKVFPAQVYQDRLNRVRALMAEKGLDSLLVYGDREHFANLHYLTGYDPRFEEALLLITMSEKLTLFVGNEGVAYAQIVPVPVELKLYQSLSLVGQSRSEATSETFLEDMRQAGVPTGAKLGVVGWKYFLDGEIDAPRETVDVPYHLAKQLFSLFGADNVVNATDLLMHPDYGCRATLDVHDLAMLELAGTKTSWSVRRMMESFRSGLSELEATEYLAMDGDPLVAHPNLNFTLERGRMGLASASEEHRLHLGAPVNLGFGYRGSMVARTGVYTRNREETERYWPGYFEKVLVPYFRVIKSWYESIGIGITGKAVLEEIDREVPEFNQLKVGLNPGHLIHTDEWTSSPFLRDQEIELKSGMGIQCDIIPAPEGFPGVHVEDGLALADKNLRTELKRHYPEAWARIQERRVFVEQELGISLRDEVLPFSDIQGCLFPFSADMETVMASAE